MTQGNLELDRNIDIDEATLSKVDTSEEIVQEEIVADPNKLYNILGVMFETTKKRYSFEIIDNLDYKKGDKVIVDTVRGKEIGIVYGGPMQLPERVLVLPLKPVVKKAEAEEIKK
ncbi:MAG: hypothetical protein ACRCZR_07310, partial [Cetobacterium sp.]